MAGPQAEDLAFMRRALDLAQRGRGWVNPNPMVGAVVVNRGEVVGEGFHPRVGEPHAEILALEAAGSRAQGGTLYVNLEPCNHYGRTGPCTERVVAAGIRRVVLANWDENPKTARQSAAVFRAAGIQVEQGILAREARTLNEPFFNYVRTNLPFLVCKMAMSLDGKIATAAGQSQWISGPAARELVQEWRATYSAVMVGLGTVLADNPSLTCRIPGAHVPWRVVVDPLAASPLTARWIGEDGKAIAAVLPEAPPFRVNGLLARGVRTLVCPPGPQEGSVDLRHLTAELAGMEISSILLEGGGELNAAALAQRVIDKFCFFVAPKVIGGRNAPSPIEGPDIAHLASAFPLTGLSCRQVGADVLLEARVEDQLPT